MVPGAPVEHPGNADISRIKRSKASKVIGSVEQGMGMLNQCWELARPRRVSVTASK